MRVWMCIGPAAVEYSWRRLLLDCHPTRIPSIRQISALCWNPERAEPGLRRRLRRRVRRSCRAPSLVRRKWVALLLPAARMLRSHPPHQAMTTWRSPNRPCSLEWPVHPDTWRIEICFWRWQLIPKPRCAQTVALRCCKHRRAQPVPDDGFLSKSLLAAGAKCPRS